MTSQVVIHSLFVTLIKSAVLRSVDQNLKPLQMGLQMSFLNIFGKVPASVALRLIFNLIPNIIEGFIEYHYKQFA